MTTDPTPDLCCEHGDAVLEQLDRIAEILEEIRDARRGRNTQRPPTPEEVRAFARDSRPNRPRPDQGHIVNTPRFQAALEDFRQKYEQGRLDEL